jgi:hypothetical protein
MLFLAAAATARRVVSFIVVENDLQLKPVKLWMM